MLKLLEFGAQVLQELVFLLRLVVKGFHRVCVLLSLIHQLLVECLNCLAQRVDLAVFPQRNLFEIAALLLLRGKGRLQFLHAGWFGWCSSIIDARELLPLRLLWLATHVLLPFLRGLLFLFLLFHLIGLSL